MAGRLFQPGKRELIAGVGAQSQFAGMNVGDKVILPDGPWTIVGAFTSGRDIMEGQLIGDTDTLMTAIRLKTYNSVHRAAGLAGFARRLKKALTVQSRACGDVERQTDWYHKLNDQFYTVFSEIAYAVGFILAVGALFCALNTMYAAVAAGRAKSPPCGRSAMAPLPVAVSVLAGGHRAVGGGRPDRRGHCLGAHMTASTIASASMSSI